MHWEDFGEFKDFKADWKLLGRDRGLDGLSLGAENILELKQIRKKKQKNNMMIHSFRKK